LCSAIDIVIAPVEPAIHANNAHRVGHLLLSELTNPFVPQRPHHLNARKPQDSQCATRRL